MTKTERRVHSSHASRLRDYILGGQDGLVNVLGLVLGVAGATMDTRLILISGLAATFAESISMAAVAYTSSKAAHHYYLSQLEREKREIEEVPGEEEHEIREIYSRKGFHGEELERIVKRITSDKAIWLESMMAEELRLSATGNENPAFNGLVVGVSATIGSFVPVIPFAFLPVSLAIIFSLVVSVAALFIIGAVKARLTIGDWRKSGVEMAVIGIAAAVIGYAIGLLLSRI